MADFLNAASKVAGNMDVNALKNAVENMDSNGLTNAAGNIQQTANSVASVGADKPNLEDRVSEAFLNLLTKDKFIQSMSSNISSILKTEILKPAFKEQLDKVKNIIAEVEKLECNKDKDKDVVNDKIKNANIVADTIQKTIDSVGAEESKNTNPEESNNTNPEESKNTNPEESNNATAKGSESDIDVNNINLEEKSVQGGKARKSRRKNTKKTRKSRRNKRRN